MKRTSKKGCSMSNQTPQEIAKWVLGLIGKHKSNSFKCPAHNDKAASASLKVYQDGVGLKCFASCTTDEICAALGIQKSDLFVSGGVIRGSRILRAYQYFDVDGKLLCEHLRMQQLSPKDPRFYWRRFDELGNEIWSLSHGWYELKGRTWRKVKDVDHDDSQTSPKLGARWFDDAPARPLYHQSRLRDATPDEIVLEQEGEKDVETAEAWGFYSTTPGGAKDWKPYHAETLAGFCVVIICDNDAPGRAAGHQKARDCYGKAARVKVIECLSGVKDKGDLTDWAAMGHTRGDLLALIEATPDYAPTGEVIENELTAVEVELDDAPLSEDPKIDKYLRQIARNAAKVNVAIGLIMRKLGFKLDHTRLLTNLASVKPDHLGTIVCLLQWLADVYGMSVDTVSRDIQKLLDEQRELGVEVLAYTPGTKNPATGQGYGSKFRRAYLRLALRAIGIAIETRGDQEYSHDALNRACDEVVRDVPRQPVDDSAKVGMGDRAEKRTNGDGDIESLKAKHKFKATVAMKRLLQAMSDDGLTLEEAEAILSDAFNDATDAARERVTTAERADYQRIVEASGYLSLNTNIDGPQDRIDNALPYGPHLADHMGSDADPVIVTESHISAFSLACEDYQAQDRAAGQGSAPLFSASAPADEISAPSGNWQNGLPMKARLAYGKAETGGKRRGLSDGNSNAYHEMHRPQDMDLVNECFARRFSVASICHFRYEKQGARCRHGATGCGDRWTGATGMNNRI
jgi:hypothetical protein